jgi:tetratricopeptide (TPR) repeat protein
MLAAALALSLAASTDEAVAAFKRGRELLAKGRLAEACAAFEQSHTLDPALGALINLAECTANLNDRPRAFTLYSEVLAWATRKNDQPRVTVARERLAALRPQLALAVIDAPADVKVVLDRVPVTTGQTVPLEPGAHVVELTRPDGSKETRPLAVLAGQTLTVTPSPTVQLEQAPPPPVPAAVLTPQADPLPRVELVRPVPAPPPSRAGPIALTVTGAAVTIAGAFVTGWAAEVWSRGEAQRQGGPLTVAQSTYETAGTLYPLGLGALIGGPLLAAGGLLWLVLSK